MKTLTDIWNLQAQQNEAISALTGTPTDKTKQIILELIGELYDLMRELDYKAVKTSETKLHNQGNIEEELIDIFKYWLTMAQIWELDIDKFIRGFKSKTRKVYIRHNQEKLLAQAGSSWIVDIDGILADYPAAFQKFIRENTGVWIDLKGYDLYAEYGAVIGHQKVRELKHEFRESGQKRTMDVIAGAKDLLSRIKAEGHNVVLLTARPFGEYKRMMMDTIDWLKDNELSYDVILHDPNKDYNALRRIPSIVAVVEDSLQYARTIASHGHYVYLLDKRYNQDKELPFNIIRVDELDDIDTERYFV